MEKEDKIKKSSSRKRRSASTIAPIFDRVLRPRAKRKDVSDSSEKLELESQVQSSTEELQIDTSTIIKSEAEKATLNSKPQAPIHPFFRRKSVSKGN